MKYLLTLLFILLAKFSFSQDVYLTKTAEIGFFSSTSMEDIDAQSKIGVAALNIKSKAIVCNVKNTSFIFKSSLMQEHFNENYMESEKYPISEFKGTVIDSSNSNLAANGTYKVWLSGKLKIHGVEKDYKVPATLVTANGKIDGRATFKVNIADHKIEKPSIVAQNIADDVKVSIHCIFEPVAPSK